MERLLLYFIGLVMILGALGMVIQRTSHRTVNVRSPFVYVWKGAGSLDEAGSPQESVSPYWWLNSGGELLSDGDVGMTVQGSLRSFDRWRLAYSISNRVDTDNGYHPQNIFRLVSLSTWNNVRVEVPYRIVRDEPSDSPNRNESNGLLVMTRYEDRGQTLYYAGVRVDGDAVIKKKYRGTYYTMAEDHVFPGTYDREATSTASSNLLPHGEWIMLASETTTGASGAVTVHLYMKEDDGDWRELLSATDNGQYGDTRPIEGPAPIGIRTDFMDVQFGTIRIETL